MLFAVEYLALGILAGLRLGLLAALATVVVAPLTGAVTIWLAERVHDGRRRIERRRAVRRRGSEVDAALDARARLVDAVTAVGLDGMEPSVEDP